MFPEWIKDRETRQAWENLLKRQQAYEVSDGVKIPLTTNTFGLNKAKGGYELLYLNKPVDFLLCNEEEFCGGGELDRASVSVRLADSERVVPTLSSSADVPPVGDNKKQYKSRKKVQSIDEPGASATASSETV